MLTTKLIVERLNKEGKLLERREQLARSFILQFIGLLYIHHGNVTYSMDDITNTGRLVSSNAPRNLLVGSPPGLVGLNLDADNSIVGEKLGIQVGTGSTAPTPTDYALETRVAHGEGADQLEYGGTEFYGLTFVNPNGEFTLRRYFTNVSGGTITIREVGIYALGMTAPAAGAYAFCIARDVIVALDVLNNEILRVTYVPQITV